MLDPPTETPKPPPSQYESIYAKLKNPPLENSPQQLLTGAQKCCSGLTRHALDTFVRRFNDTNDPKFSFGIDERDRFVLKTIARDTLKDMEERKGNIPETDLGLLSLEEVILRANLPMISSSSIRRIIEQCANNMPGSSQLDVSDLLTKHGYSTTNFSSCQLGSIRNFFRDSINAERQRRESVVKT